MTRRLVILLAVFVVALVASGRDRERDPRPLPLP
jgi:hypothetical protein